MYPDFLCIGAPKAGTTWLYENLSRHPRVWLPPSKSVLFFADQLNRRRLKKFRKEYRKFLRPSSMNEARWYARYLLTPIPTRNWYASLFPDDTKLVKGEIAPAYTAANIEKVKQAHELMPDARIIFLMRNPIDRAWSHAMLRLVTVPGIILDEVDDNELIFELTREPSILRSSYVRTLKIWRTFFREDQILVRFFEDVSRRPYDLLREICDFIGVDFRRERFAASAERVIFRGAGVPIPPHLHRLLARRYLQDIRLLREEFGSYATGWLAEAEAVLSIRPSKGQGG